MALGTYAYAFASAPTYAFVSAGPAAAEPDLLMLHQLKNLLMHLLSLLRVVDLLDMRLDLACDHEGMDQPRLYGSTASR